MNTYAKPSRNRFFEDADGYPSVWMDKDEVDSFTFDWSRDLGSDTISTSTWTGNGLTVDSSSNTTTAATAVISAAGDVSEAKNTIVTAGGLTRERTLRVYLRVK